MSEIAAAESVARDGEVLDGLPAHPDQYEVTPPIVNVELAGDGVSGDVIKGSDLNPRNDHHIRVVALKFFDDVKVSVYPDFEHGGPEVAGEADQITKRRQAPFASDEVVIGEHHNLNPGGFRLGDDLGGREFTAAEGRVDVDDAAVGLELGLGWCRFTGQP